VIHPAGHWQEKSVAEPDLPAWSRVSFYSGTGAQVRCCAACRRCHQQRNILPHLVCCTGR
jgi:hypothetical protein